MSDRPCNNAPGSSNSVVYSDVDIPCLDDASFAQLCAQVQEKLSRDPRRASYLSEWSKLWNGFSSVRGMIIGPLKSGKSEFWNAVTQQQQQASVSSCLGDSTTKGSHVYDVARVRWIDTEGFNFGSSFYLTKKMVADIDQWLLRLLKQHQPHFVLFMTRASIPCPESVAQHIVHSLVSRQITTFYVLTDTARIQRHELGPKKDERLKVCSRVLGSRLTDPAGCDAPLVYPYKKGLLYAADINSLEAEFGYGRFTVKVPPMGLSDLVQTVLDNTTLPLGVCNGFASAAACADTVSKMMGQAKLFWVELHRPSNRQESAEALFGRNGGRFLIRCLHTLMDSVSLNEDATSDDEDQSGGGGEYNNTLLLTSKPATR